MSALPKEEVYNFSIGQLRVMQCKGCGVWFGLPEVKFQKCREEGGYWHCPNGCQYGYSEGSVYKQLEKERKRREWAEQNAKNARADAASSERRRKAQKAATTRLKHRIKAGKCPCCKQRFEDLKSHMDDKHPDYNHKR